MYIIEVSKYSEIHIINTVINIKLISGEIATVSRLHGI